VQRSESVFEFPTAISRQTSSVSVGAIVASRNVKRASRLVITIGKVHSGMQMLPYPLLFCFPFVLAFRSFRLLMYTRLLRNTPPSYYRIYTLLHTPDIITVLFLHNRIIVDRYARGHALYTTPVYIQL